MLYIIEKILREMIIENVIRINCRKSRKKDAISNSCYNFSSLHSVNRIRKNGVKKNHKRLYFPCDAYIAVCVFRRRLSAICIKDLVLSVSSDCYYRHISHYKIICVFFIPFISSRISRYNERSASKTRKSKYKNKLT